MLFEEQANSGLLTVREIAERSGMPVQTTWAALAAMKREFVDVEIVGGGDPGNYFVTGVSDAARRAVGQWPSAETVADSLLDALSTAADSEQDPERKSKLRTAADAIGGVGRELLVSVVSSALTKSIGL